jgi:hypothetical protein
MNTFAIRAACMRRRCVVPYYSTVRASYVLVKRMNGPRSVLEDSPLGLDQTQYTK